MYNKDTVKIKSQESGVTGLLKKKLIQRSNKFHNVIVDINEYNTSQVRIIKYINCKSINISYVGVQLVPGKKHENYCENSQRNCSGL
jgi:hypothetical protein